MLLVKNHQGGVLAFMSDGVIEAACGLVRGWPQAHPLLWGQGYEGVGAGEKEWSKKRVLYL